MQVILTYFKRSGKYYSEGKYDTEKEHMFEIFEEVRELVDQNRCPGLMKGHSDFYAHVDVPDHPNNYPHLVIPNSLKVET